MKADRLVQSLGVGAAVGLVVAGLIGIPYLVGSANVVSFISNAFHFWGILVGSFAAAVAFGLTYAILNRHERRKSRRGRVFAGVALGVFALGPVSWVVSWRLDPFTLEGLWIYPLAIVTSLGAVALLRKRRPSIWDEPPQ